MSSVDRAWLEMDDPFNPMIVSGIIQLSAVTAPARWGRELARRLLQYPRFAQRPDDSSSPPQWIPDQPELGYHVRIRRLSRQRDENALRNAIAIELGAELDRARPLWRLTLFPQSAKRLTVLFRAHHALADGIALIRVLMNCTDAAMRSKHSEMAVDVSRSSHAGPIGGLIDRLESANRVLADLRDVATDDLHHPEHLAAQWRSARTAVAAVRRVFALPQDNPVALRQPLSGHRRVAWINDLTLAPLKKLARNLGVKLNDVFMAALAGALGDVLRARGIGMPDSQNLRVSIPVNLRSDDDAELGNCFGLVLLDLPIAMQDPLGCLELVAQRMNALKKSPEAKAVLAALAAAGHLPIAWEKRLVGLVGSKAVAVVSNLPGPRRHVRMAGARIESLAFWPPQAGGIGLGVSLFSYAGRVSLGITADAALLPEPQDLLDAFRSELTELQRLAKSDARQRAADVANATANHEFQQRAS